MQSARRELAIAWNEWSRIVELFARRRHRRGSIDAARYARVHGRLLAACSALAAMSLPKDAKQVHWASELEKLVAPWVSPDSLEHAETGVLADLLLRSLAIDEQLGGRRATQAALRRATRWAAASAAAVAILLAASGVWSPRELVFDGVQIVWIQARRLWMDLAIVNRVTEYAITSVVVVLGAIWLVATASRRH